MINFRLKGLPYNIFSRHDSYIDHLQCPESKKEQEIPSLQTVTRKRITKKIPECDTSDFDPSGWDVTSNFDNNQLIMNKRASTSHDKSKTKVVDLGSTRAKTSHLHSRQQNPQPPRKPITASFQRPVTCSKQRQSTPSQKARLGARCFLSAFSDPKNPKNSLNVALMNLIGEKKEKYVI
jgi:hypothetical protein